MPITTTAELYSASNWFPSPPIILPSEGMTDLPDFQTVSWTFTSLILSIGGYIPAVHGVLVDTVPLVTGMTIASVALLYRVMVESVPLVTGVILSAVAIRYGMTIDSLLPLVTNVTIEGE